MNYSNSCMIILFEWILKGALRVSFEGYSLKFFHAQPQPETVHLSPLLSSVVLGRITSLHWPLSFKGCFSFMSMRSCSAESWVKFGCWTVSMGLKLLILFWKLSSFEGAMSTLKKSGTGHERLVKEGDILLLILHPCFPQLSLWLFVSSFHNLPRPPSPCLANEQFPLQFHNSLIYHIMCRLFFLVGLSLVPWLPPVFPVYVIHPGI